MSSGFRRDNRDRLFEALKKAQAARDRAILPLDGAAAPLDEESLALEAVPASEASGYAKRHMALIAALVGAAAACAAIAWAISPD